jgi:hypothetical protein
MFLTALRNSSDDRPASVLVARQPGSDPPADSTPVTRVPSEPGSTKGQGIVLWLSVGLAAIAVGYLSLTRS